MSKTILFIEDEEALQKSISTVLQKDGYKVLSAMNGETAVKYAREEKYDLVLLDLILPKLNGFEILKELKENEEKKSIPVLIVTNLETSADIQKALDLGATNYLVKSNYDLDEIVKKIKTALGD